MTAIDSPILIPPESAVAPRTRASTDLPLRPTVIRTTGPIFTAILALLTCGLLPLFSWLWQWNTVRRQDRPAGDSADNPYPLLLWTSLLLGVLLSAELVWMFSQGFAAEQIRDALLGHGLLVRFEHHARFVPLRLPSLWTGGLVLAYGCYWAAVRLHVRGRMRQSGAAYLKTGLSFIWIALAALFGIAHLWWGIPMMLAGAQQRAYLSSTHLRGQPNTPAQAAPLQTAVCTAPRCQAALPASARFCPQCGTARI